MWETDPVPNANTISACPSCKGKHSRDILAMIVNYAGSIGLHVILDNHRSAAGNSAEANGLWYVTAKGKSYPEQAWITDWTNIQRWVHGIAPWTYWALNTEDNAALLGGAYAGLANPTKENSFLCADQKGPLAIPPGTGSGQCGSTGALPAPQ